MLYTFDYLHLYLINLLFSLVSLPDELILVK